MENNPFTRMNRTIRAISKNEDMRFPHLWRLAGDRASPGEDYTIRRRIRTPQLRGWADNRPCIWYSSRRPIARFWP
jgi:hypothetical protein